MKVCFVSDTHSNIIALKNTLDDISFDELVVCGDLVGYYPWPNETLEFLRELDAKAVKGNHDEATVTGDTSWFNGAAAQAIEFTRKEITVSNLNYLRSLPDSLELKLDGLTVKVYHGSPRDHLYEYVYPDMLEKIVFPKADITALGHTHWQFSRRLGETLVLNPGSTGQPRDGDPRSAVTVMDTRTNTVTPMRKKYDIGQVVAAVRQKGLPDWLGERLKQGR